MVAVPYLELYAYLFPFSMIILIASLILFAVSRFAKVDKSLYVTYQEMLPWPALVIYILGLFYYYTSPFIETGMKSTAIGVLFLLIATTLTSRHDQKEFVDYIHMLLEIASIGTLAYLVLV